MGPVRVAMVVTSVVMGVAVGLGPAAALLDRAGTVPFDRDEFEPVAPTRPGSRPFEDRAA